MFLEFNPCTEVRTRSPIEALVQALTLLSEDDPVRGAPKIFWEPFRGRGGLNGGKSCHVQEFGCGLLCSW